jgi:hypothetical protein
VKCQYNKAANNLAICTDPNEMGWGSVYSTFETRDLSGDALEMFPEAGATRERCHEFCQGYKYFGLSWHR